MIDYYKSNDFNINKTIAINDSFIMFKILLVDTANMIKTNISFLSYYSNEEDDLVFLKVEKCQLGKNIDFKYQELFKSFEKKENESIGEYFCINVIGRNISLFQNPNDNNMKDNYLRLIIYLNEPDNKIQYFSLKIVTENDIIYHNNKKNPIIPNYYCDNITVYNISEIISLKYEFQYIKYESDDGILLENINKANAIGFSGFSISRNINFNEDSRTIAMVTFGLNKSYYDYYKRTYKKFQSFLADITSLINLIISIFKLLTYFLLNKKMNKDIIRKIMIVNELKELEGKFSNYKKTGFAKKLKNFDKDKTFSEFEEKQNSKSVIKESNKIILKEKKLKDRNIKALKSLNLFDIIKSFFCFKDIKTKLIDLCNKIIKEDICIDRILSRLYTLFVSSTH